MPYNLKALHLFNQGIWKMMSEEQREAELQRKGDKRTRLIHAINSQFAVVANGARAGEIVSTSSGKRISQGRINTLFLKDNGGYPVAEIWLMDERRHEINDDELRKITAKKSPGS